MEIFKEEYTATIGSSEAKNAMDRLTEGTEGITDQIVAFSVACTENII